MNKIQISEKQANKIGIAFGFTWLTVCMVIAAAVFDSAFKSESNIFSIIYPVMIVLFVLAIFIGSYLLKRLFNVLFNVVVSPYINVASYSDLNLSYAIKTTALITSVALSATPAIAQINETRTSVNNVIPIEQAGMMTEAARTIILVKLK